MEYLEQKLDIEQRSYNSRQLCEHLKKYRQIILGAARIRELLKSRKYLWKRTRQSNKSQQNSKLCWSKLKQFLRLQAPRTLEALNQALSDVISYISEDDTLNWFYHCALFT